MLHDFPSTFGPFKVIITDTRKLARHLNHGRRMPTKAEGRRGTRRAWKQRHRPLVQWMPFGPHRILTVGDTIFMGPADYAAASRNYAEQMRLLEERT
jgi:hypothetical protein